MFENCDVLAEESIDALGQPGADRELDQCRPSFIGASLRASEIDQLLGLPPITRSALHSTAQPTPSSQRHFHPVAPSRLALVECLIGPGNGVTERLLSTILRNVDGQRHADFMAVTVSHQSLDRLADALCAFGSLIEIGSGNTARN